MTSCRVAGPLLALALFLLSFGPATAGFDEGLAAYERGDYHTAFREFMPLALAGNSSAQYNIGLMHSYGLGVPLDEAKAVRWFRLAADQGNAGAQFKLGVAYSNGWGVPQDDVEAVRWCRLAAGQGLAKAQYNLGRRYFNGRGVPQDHAEAAHLFLLAADQGLAQAQFAVGTMYLNGEGVPRDDAEAARWYRLAADQGLAQAQNHLGLMYSNGQGVPRHLPEAVRWYRLAADQGFAEAQFNLGVAYAHGQGVPHDVAKAVDWCRMAANQGLAEAQFNLAVAYSGGTGVPQDYAEAVRWYRLAADQGFAQAQYNLGMAFAYGQGVPQNYAEAVRRFRPAAAQGLAQAQHNLGIAYANGLGVPQDDVLAYMWFNLAAARLRGDAREAAVAQRDRIAARLSSAQLARGQELARNWRPGDAAASEGESATYGDSGKDTPPFSPGRIVERQRVIETQQSLADLGYDPGPVDGVMGPRTRAAIRAFQADAGLPMDGQISDELQTALTDAVSRSVAARSAPTPLRLDATGTGFAVNESGYLVTNHHVVAGCTEVRVQPPGQEAEPAVVVARDQENDLALLAAPVRLPAADFRGDPDIRAGDSVVAVGFPLHGLLASEANVTTGTVSALAGIGNDARLLQMTVPVQPGNSGGPLLDLQGRVVGVVVGKLNALQVASVTGDIPQNVNFAIKADVVWSFVRANPHPLTELRIRAERALQSSEAQGEEPRELSPAEVGARAKEFTVLVECWK